MRIQNKLKGGKVNIMTENKVLGAEEIKAALDGTSGHGLEMLPNELAEEIIGRVWQESWIRNSFRPVNMDMVTMDISKITTGLTMQRKGKTDQRADETQYGTDDVSLELCTIMGNVPIEKKQIVYGIAAQLPSIEQDIKNAVAEAEENMVLNGDTTATSAYADNINGKYDATDFPNGIVGDRDQRLCFDGLRKKAIDGGLDVNASGQVLSSTHIRKAFKQLGRLGVRKGDLLIIMSLSVSTGVLDWTNLQTVDKYGPSATILTGEIGKIFGVSSIATDLISDTLDANGVERDQSAVGTDYSVVLVVNKTVPIIGNPAMADRKFKIALDESVRDDEIYLVPIEDIAFAVRYTNGIAYIRNVLPE